MPLNTGLAMKASLPHESLSPSTHVPNNGLMESSMKERFKIALGLPSRMKTFGIEIKGMKDLDREADNFIRNQLVSKGLFLQRPPSKEVDNFKNMGSATIPLGPLFNNKEIALELTEDNKVKTSFTLNVESEPTVFSSVSEYIVDGPERYVNFYSLTYEARAINSLPMEYLKELMKRKKGLIVQTSENGTGHIQSGNYLLYELVVNSDNGIEVTYKNLSTKYADAQKAFQEDSLITIIHY